MNIRLTITAAAAALALAAPAFADDLAYVTAQAQAQFHAYPAEFFGSAVAYQRYCGNDLAAFDTIRANAGPLDEPSVDEKFLLHERSALMAWRTGEEIKTGVMSCEQLKQWLTLGATGLLP